MYLKRTENPINRTERIKINENWQEIENNFNNVVDVISEEAFERVVDSARMIWQRPVDTYNDLSTTYPSPEDGWAAQVKDTGIVYRYYENDGWLEVLEITAGPVNEVDERLSMEIEYTADVLERLKVRNLPIALDDYARTALANMCNEYLSHFDDFIYGGYHDAFRHFQPVNGKYEISCSVFNMLILSGIPFENSKYGGGNNTGNGEGYYNQELIDYYSDTSEGPQTTYRYAQHLAKYLFDRGFCFLPEDDFSNIDTGDILFYDNEIHPDEPDRFLGIDHSCVYAYQANDNVFGVWEVQNAGPKFAKYLISNYKPVLCARLPRKNGSIQTPNIALNANRTAAVTSNFIRGVTTTYPLKAKKEYTLVAKINYDNGTANVYPSVEDPNGNLLVSDYGAIAPPSDGVYVIPFSPTSDISAVRLVTRSSTTGLNVNAQCEWVSLYDGLILNKRESELAVNTISLTPLAGYSVSSSFVNKDGFTIITGTVTGEISGTITNVATITSTKRVDLVVGNVINAQLNEGTVLADFRGSQYYLRINNTGNTNYFSIVIPN